MGLAIFLVLAAIVAFIVVYPLLPGRTSAEAEPSVTDADIEQAVRSIRQNRSGRGAHCPSCGHTYEVGDQFCVRCGGTLPQAQPSDGPVCASCGAAIRDSDLFCSKCGMVVAAEEAA